MKRVEQSVEIGVAPAEAWHALVDPELGPRWMGLRLVTDWQVDHPITLCETPLGPDYVERGTLLAFEVGRLLRFDHWSPLWRVPELPENRAVATLRVEGDANRARVSFTHELPEVEALAEHSSFFWRIALGELKKLLERR